MTSARRENQEAPAGRGKPAEGATLTAGPVDGGMHLVAPPILGALSVLIALREGPTPRR
jgi:hypothetical protein